MLSFCLDNLEPCGVETQFKKRHFLALIEFIAPWL